MWNKCPGRLSGYEKIHVKAYSGWHSVKEVKASYYCFTPAVVVLTSPSQLLIATEASGMSVTSPLKTQSPWIRSLAFSLKSSCHSTKAPGATSLLLALKRRCSSFPNTVTLKNKCWVDAEVTEGISEALRATLLLLPKPETASTTGAAAPLLPIPAETTWEMYRPWESVLNGTIRPYSLNFPEIFSDETDSVKWEWQ